MTYRVLHELRCPTGDSRLLNYDGTWPSMLSNNGRHGLESGHVCGRPGSISATLGWRVDRDEHNIGLAHALGHISRENQIGLSSSNANQALAVPFALAGAFG